MTIYLGLNEQQWAQDYDTAVAAVLGATPVNIVWTDGNGLGAIDSTGLYVGFEICWTGSTKNITMARPLGNIDYNIVGDPLGFGAACGTALLWGGKSFPLNKPGRFLWNGQSTFQPTDGSQAMIADHFVMKQAVTGWRSFGART